MTLWMRSRVRQHPRHVRSFTWCRCQLCADEGYYLDDGSNKCVPCPDLGRGIALLVGLFVGIAALLGGSFVALVHPAGERLALLHPARRTVAWLACYARSIGFLPKLKILFSFYGVATVLDEVYDARMPPVYTEWVGSAFGWVQIDWVSWQLHRNSALLVFAQLTRIGMP